MVRARCLSLALPLLLAAACGDDGHDDGHHEADAGHDCEQDTRDEEFVAGMEKIGDADHRFTLVDSLPAPPAKGNNTWTLEVTDAAGAPASGTISVLPFMPDHGHGTSLGAEVTEEEPGRYTLDPVNLFMPGLWEITIGIGDGDTTTDEVVFRFCIDG